MKIIKSVIFGISLFLILNLIVTLLSYFELFNDNIINVLKIIVFVITFLLTGVSLGMNNKRKILINGVKLSSIFILISLLFILIIPSLEFSIKLLLYYLILVLIINIGNIFGTKIKKAIN